MSGGRRTMDDGRQLTECEGSSNGNWTMTPESGGWWSERRVIERAGLAVDRWWIDGREWRTPRSLSLAATLQGLEG